MYFTRHMRVLEQCISSANADLQAQINALREAFSSDTSKPFELKSTLGLRSPALEVRSHVPDPRNVVMSAPEQGTSIWGYLQDANSSKTMSPASELRQGYDQMPSHAMSVPNTSNLPTATTYDGGSFHTPIHTTYASQNMHQVTSGPQTGYALEPSSSNEQQVTPVWDPSGIFNQWNSAFGGEAQPPPLPQMPNPRVQHTPVPGVAHRQVQQQHPQALYNHDRQMPPVAASLVQDLTPPAATVTPLMWQDAFTTAFVSGHGTKRYRAEDVGNSYGQYPKRRQ